MMSNLPTPVKFLFYSTAEGRAFVEVVADSQNETIWTTQKGMSEIFGVEVNTINYHLKEIFASGELAAEATIRKIRTVQKEGGRDVNRLIEYYNLDAIISVGYRINSAQATKFRIWASQILKEYLVKGFAMDDERLKQGGKVFDKDHFKELLQRIRSIRASERRIYQQITDIFAECCVDYDKSSPVRQEFFSMVQNKFHYAITGHTAAEIIYEQADRNRANMGLTTWKYSPDGRILKSDVLVAKNYLSEDEIRRLERMISGYFDYIEDLTERGNAFTMQEFADSVNEFLHFRKYQVLTDKGRISKITADKKAIREYDEFNKTQKIVSDFDKMLILTKEGKLPTELKPRKLKK